MKKEIDLWMGQARYDLDAAHAMLESKRYLYVLFCCQQAVEKMIKAIIVKHTQELPPRLHNLMRLTETAGLEVTEERARFLRELSAYYIQTRYPEEITEMYNQVKLDTARSIMKQTEEVITWLESMLL
jgi:HEPN domain-containing protein